MTQDLPQRPAPEIAAKLSAALGGARSRLLQRAQIGRRQRVLEIGCGHCVVTPELVRRCGGSVITMDMDIKLAPGALASGAVFLQGDAQALPLQEATVDLVFCQNVLLWVKQLARAAQELARVLQPGGALVALEPDFGGMMEYPLEIALQDIWLEALQSAGADPLVGRKLPGICEAVGLRVQVELLGFPAPANLMGLELLRSLPLTKAHEQRISEVEKKLTVCKNNWACFVHVPYFLILAERV